MSELENTAYLRLLDELRSEQQRADDLMMEADTDSLTGLLNVRGLERRTRSRDWGWYVTADLDGFKDAQDKHEAGHAYGDMILQEFAEFLLSNTRQGEDRARDVLHARTGGDEFTMWCETHKGAQRIRDLIREWQSTDGQVHASAGIGKDRQAADAALYIDKKNRRQR